MVTHTLHVTYHHMAASAPPPSLPPSLLYLLPTANYVWQVYPLPGSWCELPKPPPLQEHLSPFRAAAAAASG